MHIVENIDGAFKETTIPKTYEDAYTLEMMKLFSVIIECKPIRTTAADARGDLDIST
jgi:hypothetical protein